MSCVLIYKILSPLQNRTRNELYYFLRQQQQQKK